MTKILVTCVGSGVGQSVIDSLSISGKHYVVGCDANRNVFAYQKCNEFTSVPSIYSEGYINYLLEICKERGIDLLIPGHDHELSLLSKNIEIFKKHDIKVIVSNKDIIKISRDKYEWFRVFSSQGVSIVPTFRVKTFREHPDQSILPAIIKPVGGSASQGISIINDLRDLEGLNEDDIIQPYLFPKKDDPNYKTIHKFVAKSKFVQMSEISIQLIFAIDSELEGIFISKNTLKSGVPVFVDPIQPEEFEYLDEIMKFVPILKKNNVIGPVNIQGRITEKGLFFFEMNMRFTGITGNRAQLGFNEVEYLVNNFLGIPAKLGRYAENKFGVRQVACTTIPRFPNLKIKKNLTILGIDSEDAKEFAVCISNNENFFKPNVICNGNNFESFEKTSELDRFELYKSDNDIVQSVYCKTDILVNFIVYNVKSSIYDSIFYYQEQLRTIMQANIPVVVNVFLSEKKSDYNKILSNCFSYIHLLAPAISYKEIYGSSLNLKQIIIDAIDECNQ